MKLANTCCAGLLLLSGAAPLQAAYVFQDLLDGDTIIAGDKLFSDFRIEFLSLGGPVTAPDYSQIMVEALTDGGLEPGPGLRFDFNDQMRVAGVTDVSSGLELLEFIDLTWSFDVTVLDPRLRIKDNLLVLAAALTDPVLDAGVFVREDVYGPNGDPVALKTAELSFLEPGPLVSDLIDSANFGPFSTISVTKNLFVGASLTGEVANAISVTQRFSQTVPVPASGLLLMLGLAGLAVTRRKSRA